MAIPATTQSATVTLTPVDRALDSLVLLSSSSSFEEGLMLASREGSLISDCVDVAIDDEPIVFGSCVEAVSDVSPRLVDVVRVGVSSF